MEDILVIIGIGLAIGMAGLALILVSAVWRRHGVSHQPHAAAPIHIYTCQFCELGYDPRKSHAAFPESYCSEVCEVEAMERSIH